jgi:hypothetical protein
MNRIRLAGVSLLAVLATCTVTAASASAQAPEFGRCLQLTGEQAGHGGYTNSACTSASSKKTGSFEWYPGAAKASFTTKNKTGTKIFFEGVNHTRVTCSGESSSGEYTSPKLEEHVVFRFTGCETMGLAVSSEGAASGEVVSNPTECELGVLAKGGSARSDEVGLTCAEEAAFMWMKWRGYGLSVEWCLRGWWFFTVKSNHMESVTTLHSRQSHGVQYWEKFVEGPLEPLEASFDGGKTWERAALRLTSIQTNEEAIEINSVV